MTIRIISDNEVALQMKIDVQGKALQKSMNEVIELRQQLAEAQALVEASRQQEPVYAFRRKGLDDFCTCSEKRFLELSSKQNLFEVKKLYATPVVAPDVLKDAERYRWLRDEAFNGFIVENMSVYPRTGLNAEIDAATGGAND